MLYVQCLKNHLFKAIWCDCWMPVYLHPVLSINELTNQTLDYHHFCKFLKKNHFLLGDFNIDLWQYENCEPVNNVIDTLSSNFLLPHKLLPARISAAWMLIDNISCNVISSTSTLLGNVTSIVSDHTPQFLLFTWTFY